MPQILIIAYGNPLRSDDGVAWRAADALEGEFSESEVEIICLQQLGPELAESISGRRCVIFVDAATGGSRPGEIQIQKLHDGGGQLGCGHAVPPEMIVSLSARLYGGTPEAFSVTMGGHNFEHGESLSPAVEDALPTLVGRIQKLIRECLGNRNS